jgi:hypothetical protein
VNHARNGTIITFFIFVRWIKLTTLNAPPQSVSHEISFPLQAGSATQVASCVLSKPAFVGKNITAQG